MKLAPTEGLEGRSSYGRHTGQLRASPRGSALNLCPQAVTFRLRPLRWDLDQRCVLSGRLPAIGRRRFPGQIAQRSTLGLMRGLALAAIIATLPALATSIPSDKLPSATSEGTPVEPRAVIYIDDETKIAVMLNAAGEAAGLVRANGYRCDSISGFRPFLSGNCYNLVCNEFRYEYDIEDKGGRWEVTVK